MKKLCLSFLSLIACACFAFYSQAKNSPPVKVMVLKNNTNLRAKAGLNFEVAGQAAVDQELTVKSMDSKWVEVVAPTNIDFWVMGDYLKDGLVICRRKVNVRAGPGLNFSIVGQVRNGDKVEVRGSHMEWIKIAPSEGCSLWVSRPLVEIVRQTQPSSVRAPPVKPPPVKPSVARPTGVVPVVGSMAQTGAKKVDKTTAVKLPKDLDLIPDIGQGS